MTDRLNRYEYGCLLALAASSRSEGRRTKVGCAIEDHEGRIIATGYNGYAAGYNLDEVISNNQKARPYYIHAETNALSLIKRNEGHVLYCTHAPCVNCSQNIISHGFEQIVYMNVVEDMSNFELFNMYQVRIARLSDHSKDNIKSCILNNLSVNI